MAIDSTSVKRVVSVPVPKDSVVLKLETIYDTSTAYREVRQGRAQVIYIRGPKETIVQANCLPDTLKIPVEVPCPPAVSFGVDPRYKWVAIIASALLAILILALVLGRFFAFSVQRK